MHPGLGSSRAESAMPGHRSQNLGLFLACYCVLGEVQTQRVLSTHMGYTYPNHKGNYYYRKPTLYHIGTLDRLGEIGIFSLC